jgi:hypothetical protein
MKASPLLKVLRSPRLAADSRELGPIVLLYALIAAILVTLAHSFRLDSFPGRIIGQATLDNYSIAARTSLYVTLIAVLLGGGVAAWVGLRYLTRVLDGADMRVLRLTSIAGLLLLLFGAYGSPSPLALSLLVGLHVLVVTTAVLDRRAPHPDRAAYLAWLFTGGFACVFVAFDYWESARSPSSLHIAALTGGTALGLHLAIVALSRGRDVPSVQRRRERLLSASVPLAWVPLVSLLRDEAYMQLNSRGIFSLTPNTIGIAMYAALLIWCAARWRRDRILRNAAGHLDLEGLLGGRFFPLLVCAVVALTGYLPVRSPSENFLEPANSGLMIQQWIEFGRLPFFETFNAHGLSDSLLGLVYALVNTAPGALFRHYDFGYEVIDCLLIYWLMRRLTGSPYPALFTVLLLPNLGSVFPAYCAVSILTIFMLQRALRNASYGHWTLFCLYLGFTVIWRLDVGFANIVATAAVLLALWLTSESSRPRLVPLAGGALTAALVCAALIVSVAGARGLDPAVLGKDFLKITLSNQAFGFTRMAKLYNEVVLWNLAVVPTCVILAGLYLLYRRAQPDAARRPSTFLFSALVFMSAYYFANVPRGLVRHTFVEPGNVYLMSFATVVLASTAYWAWSVRQPALRFVMFMLIASTITYHFNLDKPTGRERYSPPISSTERLPRKISRAGLQPRTREISRTLLSREFRETHLNRIISFLRTYTAPSETFLDLANSPVLYTFAHKPSPHYANHLMLAHDEYLQRRAIEQLRDFDVPLVLTPAEDELFEKLKIGNPNHVDGVPVSVRQYRLHEYVYEHYRPLAIVARWRVWCRKGWAAPAAPRGGNYTTLFGWRGQAPELLARTEAAFAPAHPALALDAKGTYFVHIQGEAAQAGRIEVAWSQETAGVKRELRERIEFRHGESSLHFVLPYALVTRTLEDLSLSSDTGFTLKALDIVRGDCPEFATTAPRMFAAPSLPLRRLPYVWGEYDTLGEAKPLVLRPLIRREAADASMERALTLSDVRKVPWVAGINPLRRMCVLDEENGEPGIAAGDTLVFAGSGERKVLQTLHNHVWLDGPLVPGVDGRPHTVLWRRNYSGQLLRPGECSRQTIQPLGDTHAGNYVRIEMANLAGANGLIEVNFGSGERRRGQFTFFVEADAAPHEYLIRVSTQYNWHAFPNDWIEFKSRDVPVTILAADLIEGD